jgi:proteic killer suppression protein
MNITFNNNKLKKYTNDDKLAERKLGKRETQLFKQRLDELEASKTLEDVRYLPGNYHELVSNRKGQWACN